MHDPAGGGDPLERLAAVAALFVVDRGRPRRASGDSDRPGEARVGGCRRPKRFAPLDAASADAVRCGNLGNAGWRTLRRQIGPYLDPMRKRCGSTESALVLGNQ